MLNEFGIIVSNIRINSDWKATTETIELFTNSYEQFRTRELIARKISLKAAKKWSNEDQRSHC